MPLHLNKSKADFFKDSVLH